MTKITGTYAMVGIVDEINGIEHAQITFEEQIDPEQAPANTITISHSEWIELGGPLVIKVRVKASE